MFTHCVQIGKFLSIILIALLAIGCASHSKATKIQKCLKAAQIKKFHHHIVKIPLKNGDRFILSFATSQLFNSGSANLSSRGRKRLDETASLIKCFETVDVKVTTKICTNDRNFTRLVPALAEERSNRIVDYLWRKKIDARIAYSANYDEKLCSNKKPNSVEINFEVWKKIERD